MKRSNKMYEGSPTVKKDENGKAAISRGTKKASETDAGTAGIAEHDKAVMKLHQRHSQERLRMHHKHEAEHLKLMQSAQNQEGSPEEEASEPAAEAASEGDE